MYSPDQPSIYVGGFWYEKTTGDGHFHSLTGCLMRPKCTIRPVESALRK